jgi:hypothetical protein
VPTPLASPRSNRCLNSHRLDHEAQNLDAAVSTAGRQPLVNSPPVLQTNAARLAESVTRDIDVAPTQHPATLPPRTAAVRLRSGPIAALLRLNRHTEPIEPTELPRPATQTNTLGGARWQQRLRGWRPQASWNLPTAQTAALMIGMNHGAAEAIRIANQYTTADQAGTSALVERMTTSLRAAARGAIHYTVEGLAIVGATTGLIGICGLYGAAISGVVTVLAGTGALISIKRDMPAATQQFFLEQMLQTANSTAVLATVSLIQLILGAGVAHTALRINQSSGQVTSCLGQMLGRRGIYPTPNTYLAAGMLAFDRRELLEEITQPDTTPERRMDILEEMGPDAEWFERGDFKNSTDELHAMRGNKNNPYRPAGCAPFAYSRMTHSHDEAELLNQVIRHVRPWTSAPTTD